MLEELIKICGNCAELFYQNKSEEAYKILEGILTFTKTNLLNIFEGYSNEIVQLFMGKLKILIDRYNHKDNLGIADLLAFELFDFEKTVCKESDSENGVNLGNGYFYRQYSLYDRKLAGRTFAEQFVNFKPYSTVVVFGDDETANDELKHIFETDDTKTLYLVTTEMAGKPEVEEKLSSVINVHNRELVQLVSLPNFDRIYENKFNELKSRVEYYIKLETFTKNSGIRDASEIGKNILDNIEYILNGSSVNKLIERFKSEDLGEIPAIIVSAGPSLDKNIKELKKAEGKALIIGVDSALRSLLDNGIKVDMAVSVDPAKHRQPFEHDKIKELPFVFKVNSPNFAVKASKNKIFFEDGYGFKYYSEMLKSVADVELGETKTGGSVANNAFSLAVDLGFKKIIFVGQDLAFTGGKSHVTGFINKEVSLRNKSIPSMTTAIGGGMVETSLQMSFYREWFEQRILELEGAIEVINSTEGGAAIKGSSEMSLEAAIKENCSTEFDFESVISSVEPILSEEKQEEIKLKLKSLKDELDALENKLKSGIRDYRKLIEFEKLGKGNEGEYRKLINRLGEINRLDEEVALLDFTRLFYKEGEEGITDDIYTGAGLLVTDIARKGEALLKSYIKGVDKCRVAVEDKNQ